MPFMVAEPIEDTTIDVGVYNTTPILTNGSLTTIKIEVNSSTYPANNRVFSFNVNLSEGLDVSDNFNFLFIKNESIDTSLFAQHLTCLKDLSACKVEKGKFDVAWNRCFSDLNKYEGENATSFKEELDTCSLLVKEKDLELTSQDDKITDLKNNEEGTKNSKYLWLIFGAFLAVVGTLLYQGKIGGGAAKERSMGEFQKSQSG